MKVGTQSMFFFLTSSSIKKMWETTHEKWQIYSFVFTVSEEDNHESTTHTDVSVPPASSRSLNFQNLKSRKVKHMVDSEQQTVTSFILPFVWLLSHSTRQNSLTACFTFLCAPTAEKSKTNHQRANNGKRQWKKHKCFDGTRWRNDRYVTLSCCSDFVFFTTNWIKFMYLDSLGSVDRVGCSVTSGLVDRIPAQTVHIFNCPLAIHWTSICSQ